MARTFGAVAWSFTMTSFVWRSIFRQLKIAASVRHGMWVIRHDKQVNSECNHKQDEIRSE
jgi:hypothetical protein